MGNQPSVDLDRRLRHAAEAGDALELRRLLAAGADVHAKSEWGWTALHWASWWGEVAAVEVLLANGADVHAKDGGGDTPLYLASWFGHVAVVEALLTAGADARLENNEGETPRDIASRRGHGATVELLDGVRGAAVAEGGAPEALRAGSADVEPADGRRDPAPPPSVEAPAAHDDGGASRGVSAAARQAMARTLQGRVTVTAPPGKLGIILANRTDGRGTVVGGVRTSSVLAAQVVPGDRIVAIDDEDVGAMNVKEITTIMARKSEFERVLVLCAAPRAHYD